MLTKAAACAGAFAAAVSFSAMAADLKPLGTSATPEGITMTPPKAESRRSAKNIPGVLLDRNGMTLYTHTKDAEAGAPTCLNACAEQWPPLEAPSRAVEVGDWSVIDRPDGLDQWAFKGQPLYRSVADEVPGDANGTGDEWNVATYDIGEDAIAAPSGVTVSQNADALGDVLVDYKGMTLYTLAADNGESCSGTCLDTWSPLVAGELAKPMGNWSVVHRPDGIRQWAYDGRPLYTFSGDERAGDAFGTHFDSRWQTAALHRYFMPEDVQMRKMDRLIFFTTADGKTIYTRDKYRYAPGSFHADDGSLATVETGREIGTNACDGQCPEEWVPYEAAASAEPSGYWSILKREDGTRQWAYQGYALYLNARDENPGDMFGRDVFDFTDGKSARYWRLAIP